MPNTRALSWIDILEVYLKNSIRIIVSWK